MSVPKTVVIVNPRSAGGAAGKRWPELADSIGRVFPFDEAITKAPGDATVLARTAIRQGAQRVVALGGDGTINEVVNGFFENGEKLPEAEHVRFGIIPFGTGGDFRRTLGLPQNATEAAKVIAADYVRKVDIGRLHYLDHSRRSQCRMFINICSFGVSGVVDQLVNKSSKRLGKLGFFLNTARATLSYKNQRVTLRFDDREQIDATINTVAVANGQYFGGAMKVAPDAEIDDGKFDVVCLGDFGFSDVLLSGRRLYQGSHLGMDKVSTRRAQKVVAEPIDSASTVELDLDGENVGILPATFELVPSAIALLVPAPGRVDGRSVARRDP